MTNASCYRAGIQFDTESISEELRATFGFGAGERGFGVVEWDDDQVLSDDECVNGELTLFSKRRLPKHKVIVGRSSRQMTLVDHPAAGVILYSVRAHSMCCHHHVDFLFATLRSRQLYGLPSRASRGNMTQRW